MKKSSVIGAGFIEYKIIRAYLIQEKFLTFYEIHCVSQQKSKEKFYGFSVNAKA